MKTDFRKTDKMFRAMEYISNTDGKGCWNWLKGKNHKGYGVFGVATNTSVLAHRFFFENFIGPIETSKQLDHLCRNRACVNPWHLEVVDGRTNTLRGVGVTAINARKTHCSRGHIYDKENTRLPKRGGRVCRSCHREQESARYWSNRSKTS